MTRTFNDNWAVRGIHTPGDAYAAAATAGTWVNMQGYRRVAFLGYVGELDGDFTMAAYEATDDSGTDAQALDGITDSFVNGTDEDRVGILEVREVDLSDGYTHVTVYVTPTATDAFSCLAVLGEPYDAPVSNATTDGVAFNTGE